MSKQGKSLDILSEAYLPEDLVTPTLGENYGLDGYPDMEYGMGVLEGDTPPGSEPSPGYKILADGKEANLFSDEPELGLHLDETLKEAGLNDLAWLELAEQDPERLPESPNAKSIPELEEAWGVNRRTDGVHLHANVDLDRARYEASLNKESEYKFSQTDLARVVRKAMRRSAAGHDLRDILREAAESLGHEAHRIKATMHLVKAEHGLAGNVFIRAAAYPGYEQGKWGDVIRKSASEARYVIVDEKAMKSAVHIQDGHCSVTKKQAVTQIPWDEALGHYEPLLAAAGRKVAGGDPRQALKAAFLSVPERNRPATSFPTHTTPSERITLKEAQAQFKAAEAPARVVIDPNSVTPQQRAARIARSAGQITEAVEKGVRGAALVKLIHRVVAREDVREVGKAVDPMLRKTGALNTPSETKSYEGPQFEAAPQKAASLGDATTVFEDAQVSKLLRWTRQAMNEGAAGDHLDQLLKARFAQAVLDRGAEKLAELRQSHEGGAGFIYVQADAYASQKGVTGCEKGSAKHRANGLKYILAMDRCASCALANRKGDGTAVCQQYNKQIVQASELPDEMAGLRKANIKESDMGDAEATASMFAPTYDANEFGLHNASLEDVEFSEAPDVETLGELLFGGMEF